MPFIPNTEALVAKARQDFEASKGDMPDVSPQDAVESIVAALEAVHAENHDLQDQISILEQKNKDRRLTDEALTRAIEDLERAVFSDSSDVTSV